MLAKLSTPYYYYWDQKCHFILSYYQDQNKLYIYKSKIKKKLLFELK